MKHLLNSRATRGTTLVELSIVIAVIILLTAIGSISAGAYIAYRDGRQAGEALRAVKAAQLMYLADNPTVAVNTLTQVVLQPYLPNGAWPTLPKVGTQTPTINCAVFPPVAVLGGTNYDPSGSTSDGLWDVGTY